MGDGSDRAKFEEMMGALQDMLIAMGESRVIGDYQRAAAVLEQALKIDDSIHDLLGKSKELIGADDRDEQLAMAHGAEVDRAAQEHGGNGVMNNVKQRV
jgi:hypothetical protein